MNKRFFEINKILKGTGNIYDDEIILNSIKIMTNEIIFPRDSENYS